MELAIVIIVGVVFVILGLGCLVSIVIGLPGGWIMIALGALVNLCDPLYLSDGANETFNWWILLICVALAGIGELLEFIAGALGAKKGGSSRRGMIGALVGGIVGAIMGLGIPIPIVGSLIGALIGTFAGAILGELSAEDATSVRETIKPATGATIGRLLGTLSKVPLGMVIWIVLSIDAFWM